MIITRVLFDKDNFDQVVCKAKHLLCEMVSPSAYGPEFGLVHCIA